MRFVLSLAALVSLISACSTEPQGTTQSIVGPTLAPSVSSPDPGPLARIDRKDTPWQRMTIPELAAAVEQARGRVTIGLKDSAAVASMDDAGRVLSSPAGVRAGKERLRALGADIVYEFRITPVVVADISPGLVAALRANPYVDYVEPDLPVFAGALRPSPIRVIAPPSPFTISQVTPWGLPRVRAPEAWPRSTGTAIKLLIIDSGVMLDHPDLNVAAAWRCIGESPIADQEGHGTHVAGSAAALNNSAHVVGVAPAVALLSANAADTTTSDFDLLPSQIACSMEVGRTNGVHVVNMSFGSLGAFTQVTDQIVAGYHQNNIVFVASAGNDFGGPVRFPARLSEVIAVTAVDQNNVRANFANVGPEVELAAPGVAVPSTSLPSGSNCTSGGLVSDCSGTSMATPHVSGTAALLRAAFPSESNVQIRERLRAAALDLGPAGFDQEYGNGLLDARKAIALAISISGPSVVQAGSQHTWSALVSGGTTPFAYQWFRDGVPQGTGPSVTLDAGGTDFALRVEVTDASGLTDSSASFAVTVTGCVPPEVVCE